MLVPILICCYAQKSVCDSNIFLCSSTAPMIRADSNTNGKMTVATQPERHAMPSAQAAPAQSFPAARPVPAAPAPSSQAPSVRRVAPTPISGGFPQVNPAQMALATAGLVLSHALGAALCKNSYCSA